MRCAGALSVSLVEPQGGERVGHVVTSPVLESDGTPEGHGLGPISVLPVCQRQGVRPALMHAALQAQCNQGAAGRMQVGDPACYRRFGFRNQPQLVDCGIPPAYFMVLLFADDVPQRTVT